MSVIDWPHVAQGHPLSKKIRITKPATTDSISTSAEYVAIITTKDIVTDAGQIGRETIAYMPAAAIATDGNYDGWRIDVGETELILGDNPRVYNFGRIMEHPDAGNMAVELRKRTNG